MMDVVQYALAHSAEIIAAITALLSGVIALCLIIPGDQPEKSLKVVVDFLAKLSRK